MTYIISLNSLKLNRGLYPVRGTFQVSLQHLTIVKSRATLEGRLFHFSPVH